MSKKMDLWNRAFKTDPSRVKKITGKDYGGSSPSPYYIVQRLTEEFGVCGEGWGVQIVSERMERLGPDDVLHIAHVRLWFQREGNLRGEIEQLGQTKACYRTKGESGYLKVDEDAPKKSVTDALVKCASYLGFAGDIFSGRWDDSKYVHELQKEFSEARDQESKEGQQRMPEGAVLDWIASVESQATKKDVAETLSKAKTACESAGDSVAYARIVKAAKARAAAIVVQEEKTRSEADQL